MELLNYQKTGKALFYSTAIFLFLTSFFFKNPGTAQVAEATSTSPDAIAIRILPNSEHYGIERWYKEKGFSGAPQFLMVDGYEAVRDGRTVYVNATNVINSTGGTSTIHTNIYLISYNQEIKPGTTDVLGQIIANWKFNKNVNSSGKCFAPPTTVSTSTCSIDGDCLAGTFCNSDKAKIIRDVSRLAILAEIKSALENYKNKNNKYPDLPSGTYFPHLTISTWPSWQSTFAVQLGVEKSLTDPINKLGSCGDARFEAKTCWDKNTNEYSSSLNPLAFPAKSRVMAYYSKNNGNSFSLCASMEAGSSYDTSDQALSKQACDVDFSTITPKSIKFKAFSLQGELGQAFSGFVQVENPGGNPLNWTVQDESLFQFNASSYGTWQATVAAKQSNLDDVNSQIIQLNTDINLISQNIDTKNVSIENLQNKLNSSTPALAVFSQKQLETAEFLAKVNQAIQANNTLEILIKKNLFDTAEQQRNEASIAIAMIEESNPSELLAFETSLSELKLLASQLAPLRSQMHNAIQSNNNPLITQNQEKLNNLETQKDSLANRINAQVQAYFNSLKSFQSTAPNQIQSLNLEITQLNTDLSAKNNERLDRIATQKDLVIQINNLKASGSNFFGGIKWEKTNNPNQLKIFTGKALKATSTAIKITVEDNFGSSVSTNTSIVIKEKKAKIEADNYEYLLNKNNQLSYVFYLNDDSSTSTTAIPSYSLKVAASNAFPIVTALDQWKTINNDLQYKINREERGRFKVTISQSGSTITDLNGLDKKIDYEVVLNPNSPNRTKKNFSLILKQDKPIFDYQCEDSVRRHGNYNCQVKLLNSDNHDIVYTVNGLNGLGLSTTNPTHPGQLKISGQAFGPVPTPSSTMLDLLEEVVMCDAKTTKLDTFQKDIKNPSSTVTTLLGAYNDIFSTKKVLFSIFSGGTMKFLDVNSYESQAPENLDVNQSFPGALLSPVLRTFSWLNSLLTISNVLADDTDNNSSDDICVSKPGGVNSSSTVSFLSEEQKQSLVEEMQKFDQVLFPPKTTIPNTFPITIIAQNEYGASSTNSFVLKVNSYCGDGVKQSPNQERRGGFYNDGAEECDGIGGTALSAASSSAAVQYSCSTLASSTVNTPNPITTNNFCRATGGYCGDGKCGSDDSTYSTDDQFEAYDPGNVAGNYCHKDCAYCGDGIVQTGKGEECDPGNPYSFETDLGEHCTASCRINRHLRILQVYPFASSTNTINVETALNTLGNTYPEFRGMVSVGVKDQSKDQVAYSTDNVPMNNFNSSTEQYLPVGNILEKYNLIIFGMSATTSPDLSTSSAMRLENFIKNGGMVIFGKNTITSANTHFWSFSDFANFRELENNGNPIEYFLGIGQTISADFAKNQAFLISTSTFIVGDSKTNYRPKTTGTSCGGQCLGNVCTGLNSSFVNLVHSTSSVSATEPSFASICNRVALIEADNIGYPFNLKIFGNLITHFSSLLSYK